MTDAMRTLFGARDNTISCLSGAGKEREQTVFTPNRVLDLPRMLWGGVIAYDPCHGDPGFVLNAAGRKVAKDPHLSLPPDPVAAGLAVAVESQVNALRWTDCRGLIDPWPDHTYGNPPYKTLAEWLEMSLAQATEHILLVPVRPNRKWWRAWARTAELVYLNPVKFEGHDGCFPGPLVLAHCNSPRPGSLDAMCGIMGLGESI